MGFYSKLKELTDTIVQLKVIVMLFLFVTAGLSFGLVTLSLKDPLVIERGCMAEVAHVSESGKRTETEIKAFTRQALSERVDSDQDITHLLSDDEKKQKADEQIELKKRDVRQRIVIEAVTVNGNEATIEGVRLFSIGDLRSALRTKLLLKFATVTRTEVNPYGLILISSASQDKKEPDKGGVK